MQFRDAGFDAAGQDIRARFAARIWADTLPGKAGMTAGILFVQTCGGVCVKKTRYHSLRKKKSMGR